MKGKHTMSSIKPPLGSKQCIPALHLAVTVFPPLDLAALTEHTTSEQGTACSLFAELKVCPKYFYLE